MPFVIGAVLSAAVGGLATCVGLDRDRGFYPVVLIVIASYYGLFAVMGGGSALLPELLGVALFAALAIAGFRKSLWIVVAALAAHGLFDVVHPHVVENPGVPAWWPAFCLGYDLIAAAYLAALLLSKPRRAQATAR
jgi:hypothetical protein